MAAETVRKLESDRLQVEADSQRLLAVLKDVADRIGEAPVIYNENGEVFVHPEMARELARPGNEALNEMFITMMRTHARRPD